MTVPLEVHLPDRPVGRLRMGTVVSVGTGDCTVTVGEQDIEEVPYLIEPDEDDTVFLIQDGAAFLVLGPSQIP